MRDYGEWSGALGGEFHDDFCSGIWTMIDGDSCFTGFVVQAFCMLYVGMWGVVVATFGRG